jgi:hypothetical protein
LHTAHDLRDVKKATFPDTGDVWFRGLLVLTAADGYVNVVRK